MNIQAERHAKGAGPGIPRLPKSQDDPLGLAPVPPLAPPPRWRWLGPCVFVLMALSMLATAVLVAAANDRKAATLAAERARLEESVRARSQLLKTWIAGNVLASRRLTRSESVRQFLNTTAQHPSDRPLPRALLDQAPFFQDLMTDFARQHDMIRVTAIDKDGRHLLSSPGPAIDVVQALALGAAAPPGWDHLATPVHWSGRPGQSLVVDLLIPITPAQPSGIGQPADVFLVLTLAVDDILRETLAVAAPDAGNEAVRLLQTGDKAEEISLRHDKLQKAALTDLDDLLPGTPLTFGRRVGPGGSPVYSIGAPVTDLPWMIVHTKEASAVLATVRRFIIGATGVAALVVLLLAAGSAGLSWRWSQRHFRDLAALHRSLAGKLDQQRRLLAAVTTSIGDGLAVSTPDGRCLDVNPAFAAAVGHLAQAVPGRREPEVLAAARAACMHDDHGTIPIDRDRSTAVPPDSHRRVIPGSVADRTDQDGRLDARLILTQDRREVFEQRCGHARASAHTVEALVHALERRDPYLLAHTRRLRNQAIAIGQQLTLENDQLQTLALAASLSQIGKAFVSDAILGSSERQILEQTESMRDHIMHALGIVERIDFGLPVAEVLEQMHERLDGSGYPHSLAGDRIGLPARILGVADVFCAQTAPRCHRDRLSAGRALHHLADNRARYDLRVIAALAAVVARERDHDGAAAADRTFVDAWVWRRRLVDRPSVADMAA